MHGVLAEEEAAGLHDSAGYAGFAPRAAAIRRDLLAFLLDARRAASRSSATAPPARATRCSTTAASGPTCWRTRSTATPTSTAGSRPGTRIPIHAAGADRRRTGPDYVLVLPWNLRDGAHRTAGATSREWGGRLVFPIPTLTVSIRR